MWIFFPCAKDEYHSNITIIYLMQISEKNDQKLIGGIQKGSTLKCSIFHNIYFLMINKTLRSVLSMKCYMLQE